MGVRRGGWGPGTEARPDLDACNWLPLVRPGRGEICPSILRAKGGDTVDRSKIEDRIRELVHRGERRGAIQLAVESFGGEVAGWLAAVLSSESDTSETYSLFLEDLCKGISKFRWESSFRTWAYRVARNAALRFLRNRARGRGGRACAEELPAAARTETKPWQRTEIKTGFADLLQSLEPKDRMILILRVDRGMSWDDVASVVSDAEGSAQARGGPLRSAAVRQRFMRIKRRLRRLATSRGLIPLEDAE